MKRKTHHSALSHALHQRAFVLLVVLTNLVGGNALYAQSAASTPQATSTPAPGQPQALGTAHTGSTSSSQDEVERLRKEVQQLREQLERVNQVVENLAKRETATAPGAINAPRPATTETPSAPQSTATPDNPRIAVASKAQGGDLSGAGTLLRNDRLTIGGYGEAQFRGAAINEKTKGGGTPTFANPRFVIGMAAVLAEKQNIIFNSELEYEFGGREIELEQAFVEWKMRPEFNIRGGIFVPALGRFNVYHDSNLNLTTIRPLVNQFLVPTAYSEAGIGVRGRFKLPHKMKLSYEFDVVNGMRSSGKAGAEAGEGTSFSRLSGQTEAAEIHDLTLQDNNRNKALIGRIALSPFNGFEFGVSGYRGRITDDNEAKISAHIFFFDASYHRGNFLLNGEYGRSNLVGGGIPRRSPALPVFKPDDAESAEALEDFLAQRTPGQDGFYIEGSYQFRPRFVEKHFDDGGYIAPVVRFEGVRLDRTIKDFYLNRSRLTLGVNIAPSSSIIFKFNQQFNHTFGAVPKLSSNIEEHFGSQLLPFKGYGRNGFTSSITYVF
ncbi:MAG: hypothetical protein HY231_08465 [Acidobacteria bacterium]|nr:hypothetical protein [Acidobacteriota bacterium]